MNKNYTRKQLESLLGKVVAIIGEETDVWKEGRYRLYKNLYVFEVDNYISNKPLKDSEIKQKGIFLDHTWISFGAKQTGQLLEFMPYFFAEVVEYTRKDGTKDYGLTAITEDEKPFLYLKILFLPYLKQIHKQIELGERGVGLKYLDDTGGALCRIYCNIDIFRGESIEVFLDKLETVFDLSKELLVALAREFLCCEEIFKCQTDEEMEEFGLTLQEFVAINEGIDISYKINEFMKKFKKMQQSSEKFLEKKQNKKSISQLLKIPTTKRDRTKGFKAAS